MTGLNKGVWAAALTPQNDDLSADLAAMVAHHRWLLANGCDGVAVLGTTGEANSFSVAERRAVIDAVAEAGLPGKQVMIGTGCCAVSDTIELTNAALAAGYENVLMLPPFYYKGLGDDHLYGAFDHVIQAVGDARLKVIVYDFPAMTGLEIGVPLLTRLHGDHPDTVVGIKDSSGSWPDMQAVCEAIPGFYTYAGTEQYLLDDLKAGGAGCISATANATSQYCGRVYAAFTSGDMAAAEQAQAEATEVRLMLQGYPAVPSLKAIMAEHAGRSGWRNLRPPMLPLSETQARTLAADMERLGMTLAQAA